MNDAVREKVDRLDRALLDTNEPPACSSECSASRLQELKIKAHEMELGKCDQMLTDAGVPEWVMNSDSNGVPSNSVASRLKWYLARRKNVERWETDQALQRDMEESLRHAQAYTQARQNDGLQR